MQRRCGDFNGVKPSLRVLHSAKLEAMGSLVRLWKREEEGYPRDVVRWGRDGKRVDFFPFFWCGDSLRREAFWRCNRSTRAFDGSESLATALTQPASFRRRSDVRSCLTRMDGVRSPQVPLQSILLV